MSKGLVKTLIFSLGIPALYAVAMRLLFGVDTWGDMFAVMSISFLYCLPTIIGALTVLLSKIELVQSLAYRILAPWIPIFIFLFITLGLNIEGWACWLMILPVFLVAASIGGVIAGYCRIRKYRHTRLQVSFLILLPLIISPVESLIGSIPGTYETHTFIDIDAPAEIIWDHVTRVSTIPEHEDTGYLNKLLGFPRPVRAELDYEGVGAYREAVFTKGLVFHETVTEYKDHEKMVFTIRANPHEIPSTTLDEHVVIGGEYFDVLDGTYKLEKLANGHCRLHLYSRFELNTRFNTYAGWWGRWIMKDIQNNILNIQKNRSEASS